ncbi:MAG TPA: Ig-like domain-containing protein, partial [Bacteroidales bacterium]|nr:Ig-like domain-containing protein [Bacteroidales bacterium]
MKKLIVTLIFVFALLPFLRAQSSMQSTFEIRYNPVSCLYEAHLHVGGIVDIFDNYLGPSGFCVVVPASFPDVPITSVTTVNPAGAGWSDNTPVYNILTPGGLKDYHKFATNGSEFIPGLVAGSDIVLFTFSLPNTVCPSGMRMFENNSPSPSPTPDPNPIGLTFDNSFQTLWGETYIDNIGDPININPDVTASHSLSCDLANLYLFSTGTSNNGCNSTLTYTWSGPGGYTSNIEDPVVNPFTAPGTYIITVTDAISCIGVDSVSLGVLQPFTATIAKEDIDCLGDSTGTATVTVTGGTPPFSYLWNTIPAQTSASITGLPAGTYSVTVTDSSNCTAAANVTIVARDNFAPVLSGQGNNATIDCPAIPNFIAPTVTDDYDPFPVISFSDAAIAGICPGTYSITRTWIATDNCGNTSQAVSQVITVQDTTPPTITCPPDIQVNADSGLCTASGVDLGTPVTNDQCSAVTYSNDAVPPYTTGITIITWTATDECGNTSKCQQTVSVNGIPIAIDDYATTSLNTAVSGNVMVNDIGICDLPVLVTANTNPGNGTVIVNPDGTFTYNPNAGFFGNDSFTYTICDFNSDCSTATVYITIISQNNPPIALNDVNNTNINTPVSGN